MNQRISGNKIQIDESKGLIAKYTEQQNNVRNNREFESLAKEVEYQTLEIELCEKRIRECKVQLEDKQAAVDSSRSRFEQRQDDLNAKRAELEEIISETRQ